MRNQDQDQTPHSSYPLSWPLQWPRTRSPSRARFYARENGHAYRFKKQVTVADGRDRMLAELERLGATQVVISTDVPTRNDGLPYSNAAEPKDHGVAVYFRLKGEPRVLACDRWDRVADNLVALAKHVEAVRGQARWGVGSLEQAFAGYRALPAAGAKKPWWVVLGVPEDASLAQAQARRDELLMRHHPDRGGGADVAAEVLAAFSEAREAIAA